MGMLDLIIANFRDAAIMHPFFPLRHFAPRLGLTQLRLNIRNFGPISFRAGSSDASTLRSVFRDLCYDVTPFPHAPDIMAQYEAVLAAGQIPVIIDAGANIGATSIWFASRFPRARIITIEPEPRNAEFCRRNVARFPIIQVVEAAIGASPGRISIANVVNQDWAFVTSRDEAGTIQVVTIPDLVDAVPNGRLFAAKIDIEGFESDLFSENTAWLDSIKFLFIEPHDWMMPNLGTSRSFQRRMAEADFELIVAGENLLYVAPKERNGSPKADALGDAALDPVNP